MAQRAWLTVDLGENGKHSFGNKEEVLHWLKEDQDAWEWLLKPSGTTLKNEYSSRMRTQWNMTTESVQKEDTNKRLLSAILKGAYAPNQLTHHSSARASFAKTLRDKGHQDLPILFLQSNAEDKSPGKSTGSLAKAMFEWSPEGSQARLSNHVRSVQKTAQDMATIHAQKKGEIEQLFHEMRQNIDKLKADSQEMLEKQSNETESAIGEWKEKFEWFLEEQRATFEKEQNFYKEQLKLLAPVEYWQNACKHHSKRAQLLFGVFALLIFATAGSLTFSANGILTFLGDKPSAAQAGIVIFIASLVLWILRMNSRLFLSSYHQSQDASERVTMLKAYLAMVRDGDIKEKYLEIALAAAFRPGVTGIVKDETAPQYSLSALLSKDGK